MITPCPFPGGEAVLEKGKLLSIRLLILTIAMAKEGWLQFPKWPEFTMEHCIPFSQLQDQALYLCSTASPQYPGSKKTLGSHKVASCIARLPLRSKVDFYS